MRENRLATKRSLRRWIPWALTVAVLACGGGAALWWQTHLMPRRFAAIVDGRLYRSGKVTPAQLRRLQREYGIGRIVSLLNADSAVTAAERRAAESLGMQWCSVPLPGDGASTPAERQQILDLLGEPNAPPTLVHCAAGVNRTGLAIGLYRLHYQHWPLERVLAELHSFGFEDLPRHENLREALSAEAQAGR